jgi:hypothetical protein
VPDQRARWISDDSFSPFVPAAVAVMRRRCPPAFELSRKRLTSPDELVMVDRPTVATGLGVVVVNVRSAPVVDSALRTATTRWW